MYDSMRRWEESRKLISEASGQNHVPMANFPILGGVGPTAASVEVDDDLDDDLDLEDENLDDEDPEDEDE